MQLLGSLFALLSGSGDATDSVSKPGAQGPKSIDLSIDSLHLVLRFQNSSIISELQMGNLALREDNKKHGDVRVSELTMRLGTLTWGLEHNYRNMVIAEVEGIGITTHREDPDAHSRGIEKVTLEVRSV